MFTNLQETISLPAAPAIPGLTFRGFAGESDYPKMLAVIEASKQVDGVERTDTLEDIRRNYSHLTNCDPNTEMLFAEINGEVIGYHRVWWEAQADGAYIYNVVGFLHPDWRRQGLGTVMLQQAEARLRQIAAPHPAAGGQFFQTWAAGTQLGLVALLESQGYRPARFFIEMTREIQLPLPAAPLPPGLEVRPVTEAHYRAIFDAANEAFRDHWGFVEHTFEEEFPRWMEDPDFNPSLWKVAWAGNEVAGMVQNFVNQQENTEYQRQRGYTEGISVRRPWRKLGLARALLVESIAMFKDMGMTETALGVDAENLSGALKLYQNVGYQEVKRNMVFQKPLA